MAIDVSKYIRYGRFHCHCWHGSICIGSKGATDRSNFAGLAILGLEFVKSTKWQVEIKRTTLLPFLFFFILFNWCNGEKWKWKKKYAPKKTRKWSRQVFKVPRQFIWKHAHTFMHLFYYYYNQAFVLRSILFGFGKEEEEMFGDLSKLCPIKNIATIGKKTEKLSHDPSRSKCTLTSERVGRKSQFVWLKLLLLWKKHFKLIGVNCFSI